MKSTHFQFSIDILLIVSGVSLKCHTEYVETSCTIHYHCKVHYFVSFHIIPSKSYMLVQMCNSIYHFHCNYKNAKIKSAVLYCYFTYICWLFTSELSEVSC